MIGRIGVLVAVIVVTGCGGGYQGGEDGLVSREQLAQAFASIDEPLVLTIDFSEANPGAAADAGFNPEREDVDEASFTLTLFRTIEAAEGQARVIAIVTRPNASVVQWKNVLLIVSASMPVDRRERIIHLLRSL